MFFFSSFFRCASMSESGVQVACEESEKKASIYVFPGLPPPLPVRPATASATLGGTSVSSRGNDEGRVDEDDEDGSKRKRRLPPSRTHARSASHGGVLATTPSPWQSTGLPSGRGINPELIFISFEDYLFFESVPPDRSRVGLTEENHSWLVLCLLRRATAFCSVVVDEEMCISPQSFRNCPRISLFFQFSSFY